MRTSLAKTDKPLEKSEEVREILLGRPDMPISLANKPGIVAYMRRS
jgi:hypothetical protein